MRNSFFKITTALSMLFLLSSNLPAQETYNLQYKFAKDNTYQYHIDMASNVTQEVMGKEMKFGSVVIGVMSFHVDDVAGNGDIQLTSSMDSSSLIEFLPPFQIVSSLLPPASWLFVSS